MKKIIISTLLAILALPLSAQLNIWEGFDGHKKVELTPYIAEGDNNIGVIVCPGGSYFWHDIGTEGHDVARWLQANGISAFVLKYRAGTIKGFITRYRSIWRGNQYPDAQNDLQRAIRYVKDRASEYRIDTTRVGAMGFSAGGHLVMSVAEIYDSPSTRPAFVAPIYPVVTFVDPCVHKRSMRGLFGEKTQRDKQMRDSLSLERHVPADCPPVFLMNCVDDPIVKYHNSELLDSALTAMNVPHRYIQYKTGGHGFGASDTKGTPECRQWRAEFLSWLRDLYSKDSD